MTDAWHHVAVPKLRGGFALMLGVLLVAGCGSERPSDTHPAPSPTAKNPAFAEVDKRSSELISTEAKWQRPAALTVGNTERVGLTLGEGNKLKQKIDTLIPGAVTVPAGKVEVGPTVRASLYASVGDADITPSEAVNASTGSDVQMLWTWLVHPKRPTDSLRLTAHLEVPLSAGHVVTHEISIIIEVKRTLAYTLGEIATHWGTWSGIGASMVGLLGWVAARRRRKRLDAAAQAK